MTDVFYAARPDPMVFHAVRDPVPADEKRELDEIVETVTRNFKRDLAAILKAQARRRRTFGRRSVIRAL